MPNGNMQRPQLNVLLHGAFVFVRDDDHHQVRTLIPRLDHHVYRAGSWLGETDLLGRDHSELRIEYELNGALGEERDPKWLTPERNVLVKKADPARAEREHPPFATLIFPLPKKSTSLRLARVPFQNFGARPENGHNPTPKEDAEARENIALPRDGNYDEAHENLLISTLQVFTYDIDNLDRLTLNGFIVDKEDKRRVGEGHYWEPVLTGNYVNLHIFSSEDHYHTLSNSDEDLNRCFDQLGVNLQLNTRFTPTGISTDIDGPLPDGVTAQETESLALRTLRLARLGRLVVEKGDANAAWYGNDATDGDEQACGHNGYPAQ